MGSGSSHVPIGHIGEAGRVAATAVDDRWLACCVTGGVWFLATGYGKSVWRARESELATRANVVPRMMGWGWRNGEDENAGWSDLVC